MENNSLVPPQVGAQVGGVARQPELEAPPAAAPAIYGTQRAQYPLIKEYALNHTKDPYIK